MAKIMPIDSWGEAGNLFVPGGTAEEILTKARGHIGTCEVIRETPEQITVQWFRVTPCAAFGCPDEHQGHWIPTGDKQTRGGFRGALVTVDMNDEALDVLQEDEVKGAFVVLA
jgi:hypothetical protein